MFNDMKRQNAIIHQYEHILGSQSHQSQPYQSQQTFQSPQPQHSYTSSLRMQMDTEEDQHEEEEQDNDDQIPSMISPPPESSYIYH